MSGSIWIANSSAVRLRSEHTHNYLVQTGVRLPEWGFEQMDVGGAESAAAVWRATYLEHPYQRQVSALYHAPF